MVVLVYGVTADGCRRPPSRDLVLVDEEEEKHGETEHPSVLAQGQRRRHHLESKREIQ